MVAYTAGAIRLVFYSDALVRIECSPARQFRDLPTPVVTNREPSGAEVDVQEHDGRLTLRTARLRIDCRPASPEPISTLAVGWEARGRNRRWRPSAIDRGNLGGTLRSLDGVGAGKLPALDPGILSRSGYFVLDDSLSPTHNPLTDELLPSAEPGYRDLYLLLYDTYADALEAAASLTGQIPMVPRWALRLWFSRYYPHSDADYREIVDRFASSGTPLDVLVLDVDWHRHGWEGFDWNLDLIPDPRGLLKWMHERGIMVGANVHPGGLPDEDSGAAEARRVLRVPDDQAIRFNLADPQAASFYLESLHRPIMDDGVDFWWIDGDAARAPGVNSQLWTNRAYYDFARRSSTSRPMILSRYGGLGSHRYPMGFSGDTKSEWAVLRYQVGFSATAGNALMPYWSHDIGGFSGGRLDPQLYIRWVQFGALSPCLRLHSDHGHRAPWEYGPQAEAAFRRVYELRMSLLPYLYSLCREAHADALPLLRPLYLEWPDDEESYRRPGQYMLGRSLLMCPVTWPAPEGTAHVDVYLPPGDWYDYHTGEPHRGGQSITYPCPLDLTPVFARAGAIIPTQRPSDRAECSPDLIIHAFAGADGEFVLYEDDGWSQACASGEFCLIPMSLRHDSDGVHLALGAASGSFAGFRPTRGVHVVLHGVSRPHAAVCGSDELDLDYDVRQSTAQAGCVIDLLQASRFTFRGTRVKDVAALRRPRAAEAAGDLEVSAALLDGSGDTPPRLVLSAFRPGGSEYSGLELTASVPDGWSWREVTDPRPNWTTVDLTIPASQPTGHHLITVRGEIREGTRVRVAEARLDWVYASVTDFRVMGVFDNVGNRGMDVSYGPETDFGFHEVHEDRVWEPLAPSAVVGDIMPVRYIDLTAHFGEQADVVAYAMTYIHSESPREIVLDLGADDGVVAWFNAREVLRAPEPGPAAPGQFSITVSLRAGWNQLMLKIGQLYGDWGFYCELRDEDGEAAEGIRASPLPV